MILLQVVIWIVGLCSTFYVAGYLMFFDGAVDMVMSIVDMFKNGVTLELAKTAVWGFIRLWIAGLVGWLIVFATSAISLWIGTR